MEALPKNQSLQTTTSNRLDLRIEVQSRERDIIQTLEGDIDTEKMTTPMTSLYAAGNTNVDICFP